ncbi:gliding motility lipoprotein GldH [Patiriisocius sp. Uisw_047]|jgi:gliding motility-associated lipoprotein GldH|uniref:gliding motility lipoprotein GldH n=1 Tax=Patiriisocius sp. Uisw_047 TaxID=3230969 RepID=UPI0039EA83A4
MRKLIALFCVGMLLTSCLGDAVAGDSQTLPSFWDSQLTVDFTFPELEKEQDYNVYLQLRNTNEYPYSNIFLITTLRYPNGKTAIDTLEYRMARPDGTWLGEGIGSLKQSKLVLKEKIQFNEEGEYHLEIGQALRNNNEVDGVMRLLGITDVGYTIEKAVN